MKTVKAILTETKFTKHWRKGFRRGYKRGYSSGKEMGALIVFVPSLIIVITLIAILFA